MKLKGILTAYFIVYALVGLGQVTVRATLDSNVIKIGGQVNMQLEVKHDTAIKVVFPELKVLGEKVEVVKASPVTIAKEGKTAISSQNITVTSFDSGHYQLPPVPISYNKGRDTAFSSALALSVGTVGIDTAGVLAPIKDIMREPLSFREDVMPYLLVVLGIGALSLLIFFLYQRYTNRTLVKKIEPEPIQLPAHVIAFRKLDELEDKRLWEKGAIKPYQSELTHIVREYLENRYDVVALETTTEEIIKQINQTDMATASKTKLRQMLELADLVKFAKVEPPSEQHKVAMNDAKEIIEVTKKMPSNEIEDNRGMVE